MAYEDTIRVAELKIRASRFARVREEVQVERGQILEIAEFFHPRMQEIADTLPAGSGAGSCAPAGRAARRAAHAQGQDRQDHVDQRLPAALRAREAQAAAPPLAALRRGAGAALAAWLDLVAATRAKRLCARAAGGAHAKPGEGLWRYP